jgi:polar amino acid transport system substrate-binding protein
MDCTVTGDPPPIGTPPTTILRVEAIEGIVLAGIIINLGNPVLAQGTAEALAGVTVDIARELGTRLGVTVELVCVDAARTSFDAVVQGDADIAFLMGESAGTANTLDHDVGGGERDRRATASEVDRDGVRIGVRRGSAYDLFLSRTLRHAQIVRGDEGVDVFRTRGLEVGAGIRQPVAAFVDETPGYRLLDDRFMEIRQALGTSRRHAPATHGFLHAFIEDLKQRGFVADSLVRAGQHATVAALEPTARSTGRS